MSYTNIVHNNSAENGISSYTTPLSTFQPTLFDSPQPTMEMTKVNIPHLLHNDHLDNHLLLRLPF